MEKLKNFLKTLKNSKHFVMILAIFIAVIIVIFYFSTFTTDSGSDTNSNETTDSYTTADEYVDYLENKLGNVLSKITGVGEVSVIITLESGFTYEYAYEAETKTTTSGSTTTTIDSQTLLVVNSEPVIVKEIYPVIKGVVIVAEGSENFQIKMNILDAVLTVLDIDSESIIILY